MFNEMMLIVTQQVVGGGYIAVEFASIFQSFLPPSTDAHPSLVTLCHRGDNILRGFDNSVRDELRDQLKARGIDVRLHDTPTKVHSHVLHFLVYIGLVV
jgi:pyruvate/2-oxoglutarate dehydrogenase complex dihydrolipoamide dehydrogenase (E3) component